MGKPVTAAKVIPLLTMLTGIPTDELEANYAAIRNPSKDTLDRLEAGVKAAAACLKPMPVAALFRYLMASGEARPQRWHHWE